MGCFVEEAGGQYCSSNAHYPCSAGKEYRGRGPKQLSWNYNYGQFSEEFCGDKSILLNNPQWVATNPTLAWASSIWFWFTGGACLPQTGEICRPGCHEVFLGTKTSCPADEAADRQYGLGKGSVITAFTAGCASTNISVAFWVSTHWRRVGQRMIIFSALISRTMLLHRLLSAEHLSRRGGRVEEGSVDA